MNLFFLCADFHFYVSKFCITDLIIFLFLYALCMHKLHTKRIPLKIARGNEPILVKKSAVRSIKFERLEELSDMKEAEEENPSPFILGNYKWQTFACGMTQDQLDLTQLAHQYMRKTALKPRSLNFL